MKVIGISIPKLDPLRPWFLKPMEPWPPSSYPKKKKQRKAIWRWTMSWWSSPVYLKPSTLVLFSLKGFRCLFSINPKLTGLTTLSDKVMESHLWSGKSNRHLSTPCSFILNQVFSFMSKALAPDWLYVPSSLGPT